MIYNEIYFNITVSSAAETCRKEILHSVDKDRSAAAQLARESSANPPAASGLV
jgi:hypothetical protein